MKPIFNEEKLFFESRTGLILPYNCWRDGGKIYLNADSELPLMQFKIENKQILIRKNIIKEIRENLVAVEYKKGKKIIQETWVNKTPEEEWLEREEQILLKEEESIDKTVKFIIAHPKHELRQSDSGGKDSTLTKIIVNKAFERLHIKDYVVDSFNTTNDTAHTYLHIKKYNDPTKLQIHNPPKGWRKWIKEDKNFFVPSVTVRNCCSTYKEGQLNKILDKKKNYILFLGMRKHESSKRKDYDWDLNEAIKSKDESKLNVPENWRRFLPIVDWKDEEVWLYLLHFNIPFNYMYRLGFNRCGCLICPFQDDYIDLLTEHQYKLLWNLWMDVVDKNYEVWKIDRLNWTPEEWRSGKWKAGMSKDQEIIQKKATPERIKQLAELKNISYELAEKYFQKRCSCSITDKDDIEKVCNKKLNPTEVAMNLKIYGRGMDVSKMQCKKCMCNANGWAKKQYQEKAIEFINQGCNLF